MRGAGAVIGPLAGVALIASSSSTSASPISRKRRLWILAQAAANQIGHARMAWRDGSCDQSGSLRQDGGDACR